MKPTSIKNVNTCSNLNSCDDLFSNLFYGEQADALRKHPEQDNYFIRDMAEVEKMIKMLDDKVYESDREPVAEKKVQPTKLVKAADGKWVRAEDMPDVMTAQKSCDCCCPGHCRFNVHNMAGSVMGVNFANKVATDLEQLEFPKIFESYLFDEEEYDVPIKSNLVVERDELYDAITCLETDFNLD